MVKSIERDPDTGIAAGNLRGLLVGRLAKNNTSGARGVTWHKGVGKWLARASERGKTRNLGYFDSFEEAVKAREKAVKRIYGDGSK